MTIFKEDSLQIAASNYMKLAFPKVLFHHCASERKTSPQSGARLKAKGQRKGMPDCLIFYENCKSDRNSYCGLAIELKIKPNKPSPEQIAVLAQLEEEGWQTHVCYSFDEFKKIVDEYLS